MMRGTMSRMNLAGLLVVATLVGCGSPSQHGTDAGGDDIDGGSDSAGDDASTQRAFDVEQISMTNRRYPSMYGGWGSHLRAPLRTQAGERWFVEDAGPDVDNNTTIRYFRHTETGWVLAGEQPHGAVVQQNSAHVMLNDFIFSYSVNISAHYIEECYFHTSNVANHACNAVTIGSGVYATPVGTNYVGAAISPSGYRLVWWTTVGNATTPGTWSYTYNFGGGWNGPVTTAIGNVNGAANAVSFEYVSSTFLDDSTVAVGGLTFTGDYSVDVANPQAYRAVAGAFTLGNAVAFTPIQSGNPSAPSTQITSLWADAQDGVHFLVNNWNGTGRYYYKAASQSFAQSQMGAEVVSIGKLAVSATELAWVHPVAGKLEYRAVATPSGFVDWTQAPVTELALPAAVTGVSAFYTDMPSRGPGALTGSFAICGDNPNHDNYLFSYTPR